ncbi:MAG: hypothetical protein ABI406_16165 [Ktedonobacteraceae bacterium]
MLALVLLELLIILNIAAWKWGFDSTDGINSPEWERRRSWGGFH